MPTASHLFVLTGGPGSGKTSLIEAAQADGIATTEEVGRAVIREQVALAGSAVPWNDRAAFARLMLEREVANFDSVADLNRPVLGDRGVPDVVGYAMLEGLVDLDPYLRAAHAYRYAPVVFVAPPWMEIYGQDEERRQDWELAVRTCEMMVSVYGGLGYDLIELPKADVATRLAFVKARMNV